MAEREKAGKKEGASGNVVNVSRKFLALVVAAGAVLGLLVGFVTGMFIGRMAPQWEKERMEAKEKSGKYYEVAKQVTLGKYQGRKISLVPTQEEIQTEIDSLLQENTNYEQVKGTARNGDMVYARFEGKIDGKIVDQLCGEDYVEIGAAEWPDGFEQAFEGMKTGKKKEVKIDIPDGFYGNVDIDGKTVTYELTLNYICGEAIVPEYNDEFVQSVSEYNTVDEYNAYLKEKLARENEEEKAEFVWTEVLDDSEIKKYPEKMLEQARQEVLQGYYNMADLYGQSHDEIFQSFGLADEQEFKDTQLEELAQDTVKEIMVAQAIANKEGISYTKKEYSELLTEEYGNNSDSYKDEQEYEKENKTYLENTALIEKVKEWVSDKTKYER